ncbi:MAG: DUF5615 family PIN-like protein [Candidatus Eremiobacterota bacterium]
MRIKLDENLPCDILAPWQVAHDVDTVEQEGLTGRDDPAVWQAAQREHRLLITQDLDFSDLRRFLPGTHHGVLLIRMQNPSRRRLVESWAGCFVVATDSKIRVRRPAEHGS